MKKGWFHKNLSLGEKYVSLEVNILAEGKWEFLYSLIKMNRKEPVTAETGKAEDARALRKILGKDHPVILTFTGRGIITKSAGNLPLESVTLSNVLPNANTGDFLFQAIALEEQTMVAVIRTETFETVFEELTAAGLRVAGAFIGPVFLFLLPEAWEHNTIIVSGYQVSRPPGSMPEIKLAGENAGPKKDEFLRWAAVHAYLKHKNRYTQPALPALQAAIADERHRKRFELTAQVLLLLILGLFVVNRLASLHYSGKYAQLEVKQAMAEGSSQETNQLLKELAQQKELAGIAGSNNRNPACFYADQIASLVPKEVILDDLTVFPLQTNETKMAVADFGAVTVSGRAISVAEIHAFVAACKTLDWVSGAVLNSIREEAEELNFVIHINLKQP